MTTKSNCFVLLLATLTALATQGVGMAQDTPRAIAATRAKGLYTCSMHPQIHGTRPNACPLCGMKLVAIETPDSDVAPSTEHGAMTMPDHEAMPMDHAGMQHVAGGCGMCMDMTRNTHQEATTAARKTSAQSQSSRGTRGGRGCGC
jgi:hypothetical protein